MPIQRPQGDGIATRSDRAASPADEATMSAGYKSAFGDELSAVRPPDVDDRPLSPHDHDRDDGLGWSDNAAVSVDQAWSVPTLAGAPAEPGGTDDIVGAAIDDHVDAYTFLLEPASPVDLTSFYIAGWVTNRTGATWSPDYRIGIRNFKDAAGLVVEGVEFRGTMGQPMLRPGQTAHFTAEINPSDIPPEVVSCELDVVREGHFWFSERGAQPITVPVAGFLNVHSRDDAIAALSRLSIGANDAERRKIAIIQQSLRLHDFSRYDRIAEIRKLLNDRIAGRRYHQPVISSRAVAGTLGTRLGRQRREAFFQAFASRMSGGTSRVTDTPLEQLAVFKRYVHESDSFFRNSTAPIPFGLASWLGARAMPSDLASAPVSRSMIAALGSRVSFHFEGSDNFRNLMWTYATSVMIDRNLPIDLVPDTVLREMATSPVGDEMEDGFPYLTGFMQRLRSEDRNYGERYDVNDAAGRCSYAFDLLLLGMQNEARRLFLGQEVLNWMTRPIGPSISASPFEVIAFANMGWRGTKYLSAADQPVADELRILRESYDWLPAAPVAESYPVRVIGRRSSQSGLGTNMRMTIKAIEALGMAVEVVDCDIDRVIPAEAGGRLTKRPIEIYHLNCDDVPALVSRYATHARPDPYRIAFTLWEASVMPEQHRAGAMLMDELWVPTEYLKRVYEEAGFENVQVVGKGIDVSEVEAVPRTDYGLHRDDFVFVTSFDLDSWVERKNPSAVVDAFARAFPDDRHVRLIIKTTGIFAHPGDRNRQVARLLAAADADDRILLINERMPFSRYLGLIEMADALISAHRSEGFGYLPAYAMMLGRPVIVTDHSGTQDFCDETTAFPVAADLVPIPYGDFVYEVKGAAWADINVDDLAATMKRLRRDPNEGVSRAANAREKVNALYTYDALTERYRQRFDAIG